MKKNWILAAAVCAAILGFATQAAAQAAPAKKAFPARGEASAGLVRKAATVVSVDRNTREVALRGEDGGEFTVVVDRTATNLDQLVKGDSVVAAYVEALVYEIHGSTKAGGGAMPTSLTTAAAGEGPGAARVQKTTATVSLSAIDPKVPSVTFRGPGGNIRAARIQDPAKLERLKVGDTVDVTYSEAIAVAVEKAAAEK